MFSLGQYGLDFSIFPMFTLQCRSKGNISGGACQCQRCELPGGSGGMKFRGLEMLFPAFSKSYL